MNIINAIEQEAQIMRGSEEGSKQYRKGYIRALEVISAFFRIANQSERGLIRKSAAVERLLASPEADNYFLTTESRDDYKIVSTVRRTASTVGAANMIHIDAQLSVAEQTTLTVALGVLRSNTDYSDFLNSWLVDYGTKVVSQAPLPPLLPEGFFDSQIVFDVTTYIH